MNILKTKLTKKSFYLKGNHLYTCVPMLLAFVLLTGCQNKEEEKVTVKEVKKETNEAMKASANFIQQKKDKKLKQLTSEMNRMEKNLKTLKNKAESKLDENMKATVKALQERQENFEVALKKFQQNTNTAWEKTAVELDNALKELDQGYQKALNEISLKDNLEDNSDKQNKK